MHAPSRRWAESFLLMIDKIQVRLKLHLVTAKKIGKDEITAGRLQVITDRGQCLRSIRRALRHSLRQFYELAAGILVNGENIHVNEIRGHTTFLQVKLLRTNIVFGKLGTMVSARI